MEGIAKSDFNLNISRYVSKTVSEVKAVNEELMAIEKKAAEAIAKHNQFLKELGLSLV